MKPYQWLLGPFLSFFIVGLALGETYSTNIQYQPVREFPSLQQKVGSILAIAPFKDDRSDKLYIGHQTSFGRVSRRPSFQTSHYFKSEPFPLEKAISDSLSKALSRSNVKTVPISTWVGEPGSLKNIGADSILMIEIKRFWSEGVAAVSGTKVITSIYLVIHLGVKKEGKVFKRNVYAMKESKTAGLKPAKVEQILNRILTEILDNFFSNPY
ncbi:MAG TPA: hypothetical protein VLK23_15395 [Thermodesulfobacteriota bacterium]|nr:hypothetical protein [Thermodesulfobacteriota bacterium]